MSCIKCTPRVVEIVTRLQVGCSWVRARRGQYIFYLFKDTINGSGVLQELQIKILAFQSSPASLLPAP
jgi:hypothetical protein